MRTEGPRRDREPARGIGRLLAGGMLASAASVLVTVAVAQPRPHPGRPAPKPKAAGSSAPESPYDERSSPTAPAASAGGAAPGSNVGDAGPVPSPAADSADGGGALSPLNPAPNEFSDAGPSAMSIDYDRLLADIASLRARVAAVSDTLFHSRIAIALETSGDHGRIASLGVSLDDGVVWTSPSSFRADDATTVYDHAVAPGHHAVGVDVERRDDRNDAFRSIQRSRFIVDVPADQKLSVDLKLWDDSSMGGDFPTDKNGQYELRVRMRAKVQPLPR
jgi:hypothetical protein